MSLDDVFGPFPGRSSHPDMARLSNAVLWLDGEVAEGGHSIKDIGDRLGIDVECVAHMATQRAMRAGVSAEQMPLAVALWADAFFAGLRTASTGT